MRPVAAAITGLVLLVITACSGENEPNLAEAVDQTEATRSSGIELRATSVAEGRTLDLRCVGIADHERKRLRIGCNHGLGELIVIGDTHYVPASTVGGRTDKPWVKAPVDENDSRQNFSPVRLFAMLRAASLETVRIGEESVRDVPTIRYRLTLNCDEARIDCPGTTEPVDVWIDDDGLVRRIQLEDNGAPGTIELYDFGLAVEIQPPPADQIEDISDVVRCDPGGGSPIRADQAVGALLRHGFSVEIDEQGCFGPVAAVLENKPADLRRQGYVSCFLYAKQPAGAPTSVDRRGTDGADARLALANLVCTILADSPRAEEKIRPLEQAFEELERAIRP